MVRGRNRYSQGDVRRYLRPLAFDGGAFQEDREPRPYVRALYRLVQFRADQFGGESVARDGR